MKKKLTVLLLSLCMLIGIFPVTAFADLGTGHQISVKLYTVKIDSSKPLGYTTPEYVKEIVVTCEDSTGHSGYNHSVSLKKFHPSNVGGVSSTNWKGWQFNSYFSLTGYTKGIFYAFDSSKVNATANVTGSEPYRCSKNFYYVYEEPAPVVPAKPDADKLSSVSVTVDCVTSGVSHSNKTYGLLDSSYTIGEVKLVGQTYQCDVTVNATPYVAKYNTDMSVDHSLKNGETTSKTIKLDWNGDKWVAATSLPIVFKVVCQTPPSEKLSIDSFAKERLTTLPDGLQLPAGSVNCDNSVIIPEDGSVTLLYKLTVTGDEGANFVISDTDATLVGSDCDAVQAQAGADITGTIPKGGTATVYVTKTFAADDIVDGKLTNTASITAGDNTDLTDGVGDATADTPAEVTPTIPDAPTYDDMKDLLPNVVEIDCTNAKVEHASITYALIEDSYTISNIEEDDTNGYYCTLTISPDKYVTAYNEDKEIPHKLDPEIQDSGTVTLLWNDKDDVWYIQESEADKLPLRYTVTCDGGDQPVSEVGSLTVSKTVSGTAGDTNKDWHFTVTLNDTEINGTYGDMMLYHNT